MNLRQEFEKKILPALQKKLGIKNPMAVPRLTKIVVNVGFGSILTKRGEKNFEKYLESLAKITGQKPALRRAKKSISNFKLRENNPVGATATLRRERMYDFLERFILMAIPRIRDFRGFARRGDSRGNLNIGVYEHNVFPEVGEVDVKDLHGIGVTICTTAASDKEMFALMDEFKFPFKKKS